MRASHPPVPVQLRRVLERARSDGLPFDEAWQLAVGFPTSPRSLVRFPHATVYRREWVELLESQREEWAAAYEGRQTTVGEAVEFLLGLVCEDASGAARRALLVGRVNDERPRMARAPMHVVFGPQERLDAARAASDRAGLAEIAA